MFVVVSFMNWLGDVVNDFVDNWLVVDNLVMDGSHMIVFLASFGYFRVFLGLMVSLMRLLFRIGLLFRVPSLLVGTLSVFLGFFLGLMFDWLMMVRCGMESTGHIFCVEVLGHFNVPRIMMDDWLMINGRMNGLNLDVSNLGSVIWLCVVRPFDVLRLSILVGSKN